MSLKSPVWEIWTPKIFKFFKEKQELVMDREAWHAAVRGVAKSRTRLSDGTELMWASSNQTAPLEHTVDLLVTKPLQVQAFHSALQLPYSPPPPPILNKSRQSTFPRHCGCLSHELHRPKWIEKGNLEKRETVQVEENIKYPLINNVRTKMYNHQKEYGIRKRSIWGADKTSWKLEIG